MFDNIINLKDKQLCLNVIFGLCIIVMAFYIMKQNKQMEHMTNMESSKTNNFYEQEITFQYSDIVILISKSEKKHYQWVYTLMLH